MVDGNKSHDGSESGSEQQFCYGHHSADHSVASHPVDHLLRISSVASVSSVVSVVCIFALCHCSPARATTQRLRLHVVKQWQQLCAATLCGVKQHLSTGRAYRGRADFYESDFLSRRG